MITNMIFATQKIVISNGTNLQTMHLKLRDVSRKEAKKKKKKKDKRRRKEMKRNWMNLITTVFLPLKSNRIWILHLSIQNISF